MRSALCALSLLLSACPSTRHPSAPRAVESPQRATPLVRLKKVTVQRQTRRFGALELLASYELTSERDHFGGLSGLTFSRDGRRLIFITDRGKFFTARVAHDERGALSALTHWEEGSLLDAAGKTLTGNEWDAESLTRGPRGGLLVGFEKHHRILLYPPGFAGPPRRVALPPKVSLPFNGGLEAMTSLPDGRLLILSEKLVSAAGMLRGWLGEPERDRYRWREIAYVFKDDYHPTAIAALPTGDVIVLERFFSPLQGLRSRLRRIDAADLRPGARLDPGELARLDRGLVDNFEGLAVRFDGVTKRVTLYIVSDDNFNALQRTLLYQFVLLEP